MLAAFRALGAGAAKADLWRYCVLYQCGGVYLDLDASITVSGGSTVWQSLHRALVWYLWAHSHGCSGVCSPSEGADLVRQLGCGRGGVVARAVASPHTRPQCVVVTRLKTLSSLMVLHDMYSCLLSRRTTARYFTTCDLHLHPLHTCASTHCHLVAHASALHLLLTA